MLEDQTANTERLQSSQAPVDNSPHHQCRAKTRRRELLLLAGILVISFVVRVAAWEYWGTGPIEVEGSDYTRIAENLRWGVGYVGMSSPGTNLLFPPLFPLLISGFSFLTRDYTLAARSVAMLFGTLLPLPVFGIASQLFSRRTAYVAAALTILSPLLVRLSFAVYSEGPYATLVLAGGYLFLCALSRPSIWNWGAVGATFGLAYLVRQEGFVVLLLAASFALAAKPGKLTTRCLRAASAILMFLLLAMPEIIFIHHATGKFSLEVKSGLNFPLGIGTLAEGDRWANYGVEENLNRVGVWMRPNSEVIRERVKLRDAVHMVSYLVRRNIPFLLQTLSERWMGAPFVTALALLGAVRRPWKQQLAWKRLFFVLVPLISFVGTLSVMNLADRYFFVLVPFLLLWAANGLVELGLWLETTLRAQWNGINPFLPQCLLFGIIGLALVIYPQKGVRGLWLFMQGSPARKIEKDVGLWVKQQQTRPIRIMDMDMQLAFYADATLVWAPSCSADTALRFLDDAKVDYVVVRRGHDWQTPYYADWQVNGISDPRAELVYTSPGPKAGELRVYRWHRSEKPSAAEIRWFLRQWPQTEAAKAERNQHGVLEKRLNDG
jgi:4-amino-4-deoxy-L-arabinose transferase-like glycosyltransferase